MFLLVIALFSVVPDTKKCKEDYSRDDYKFLDNKYFGPPFQVDEMISMEGVKDYYVQER